MRREPPVGSIVRDNFGRRWWHCPEGYWAQVDADDDPESWVKVSGNYGPVVILHRGAS